MLTYVLREDKSLIRAQNSVIYQRDKLMDKMQIFIPKMYQDYFLDGFTIVLKYTDPEGELHVELLEIEDYDYKEKYLKCVLPVDTKITRLAGTFNIFLSLLRNYGGTQYVLQSGNSTFTVEPTSNLYDLNPDEFIGIIDQEILKIKASVDAAKSDIENFKKADNIAIVEETIDVPNDDPNGDPFIQVVKKGIRLQADGSDIGDPIFLEEIRNATEESTGGETFRVVSL